MNEKESDENLEDRSDDGSVNDGPNRVTDNTSTLNRSDVIRKNDRFYKLFQVPESNISVEHERNKEQSSEIRTNMLSQIFKEDISGDKADSSNGLLLDQTQFNILKRLGDARIQIEFQLIEKIIRLVLQFMIAL